MRYYYTDRLAAAWMAKHFKMKFTCGNTPQGIVFTAYQCYLDGDERIEYYGWLYIHPDSEYLLEPQKKNDVILNDENDEGEIYQRRIIMRDDKPFHWPESEEE